MMVTATPNTDKTCTIMPGDHRWVTVESNIDYSVTRVVPVSRLESAIKDGRFILKGDAPKPLLARIRAGVLISSETPNDLKADFAKLFPELVPK